MVEETKTNKFVEIESKWQKFWEEHPEISKADDGSTKEKKYVLVEFPYPSGSGLHIGHAFSFTGGDVYARFKRMQGYNVMFPMGWDAFGLPTENYAIKTKQKPQKVTKDNTDMFRSQMKRLAFSFDWEREVNTTDPKYYKWTQWIFIKLFEKGLAEKQEMPINWCPSCKIGLANEEVVNGKCERCGTEVERRTISQWVVKITEYADRLAEGLKNTDFIDKVKQAQINWIDCKEWIDITYDIDGEKDSVTIATTRPDTNFGATFIVLAPEHELVSKLLSGKIKTSENLDQIKKYVVSAKNKSELERQKEVVGRDKSGVFTGLYAVNQLNNTKMPIWITDFVLATVGTGAVVGVPASDVRDFEFATQFKLPIVRVIYGEDGFKGEITKKEQVCEEGTLMNSGFLDGLKREEAIPKMMAFLESKGWGKKSVRYHLRDWIFSRQHYWGEPIPMVDCPKCGWVAEKEGNLPIVLPEVEAYEPTDDGKSPLSKIESFVNCTCPKCGRVAKRETDTMPNWAGSDWYFLRYIDPFNDAEIASQKLMKKWMPVDVYIGGDEHNTLHLLYSRFIYQFLWDLGVVPHEYPEPYRIRTSHGVILGPDNQRMSKTKGNVIVPESVADKYGVDVTRMYLMFMGPFDGTMAWNENTLMGVKRFLERFERLLDKQSASDIAVNHDVDLLINKTIDGVTRDIENFRYNTAIAKIMECLNKLMVNSEQLSVEEIKTLIKLLAPFAPYTAEEMWSMLGGEGSVHAADWPVADPRYLVEEEVTIAVAVNGKVRDQIKISLKGLPEGLQCSKFPQGDFLTVAKIQKEVIEMAKGTEKMKKWLEGKRIIKEVYVPGKMVNLVVEGV